MQCLLTKLDICAALSKFMDKYPQLRDLYLK